MKSGIMALLAAAGLLVAAQAQAGETVKAGTAPAEKEQTQDKGEETPPIEAEDSDEGAQTPVVAEADPVAGGKFYKKNCRSCHGPKARGMASFPKLTGHPADYLIMRLEQYRAGEKVGPNTPLMAPRAKRLTDEDIANIAAFITTAFK